MNQVMIAILAVLILMIVLLAFYLFPLRIWSKAQLFGVWISYKDMKAMKKKKVPDEIIFKALIAGRKGKILMYTDQLIGHYLAGGDLENLVDGLIAAQNAGLRLTFEKACAADFNDINLVQAVDQTEYQYLYQ